MTTPTGFYLNCSDKSCIKFLFLDLRHSSPVLSWHKVTQKLFIQETDETPNHKNRRRNAPLRDCIVNCPEGALQLIDGKARLVSEVACDGLGACIGHCPFGAITVEEREAPPYDERSVVAEIAAKGPNVLKAHLLHLKDHGQTRYLSEALSYLQEKKISVPDLSKTVPASHGTACGCPGATPRDLSREAPKTVPAAEFSSALGQWPIQLHLISPALLFPQGRSPVAADCTAFAMGNFTGTGLRERNWSTPVRNSTTEWMFIWKSSRP